MALNDKATNRTNATMRPGCADILGALAIGPGVAAPHGNSTFRSEATAQAPSNGDLECGVVHQNVCIRLRCEKAACTWASTASEDCRAPIIEALEKCLSGCLAVRAKQGTLLEREVRDHGPDGLSVDIRMAALQATITAGERHEQLLQPPPPAEDVIELLQHTVVLPPGRRDGAHAGPSRPYGPGRALVLAQGDCPSFVQIGAAVPSVRALSVPDWRSLCW